MTEEVKTFIVNKDSWHYRLNVKMLRESEVFLWDDHVEVYIQTMDNFCKYWRLTAVNLIKVAFMFAIVLAVVAVVLAVVIGVVVAAVTHPFETGVFTGLVLTVLAIIFGLYLLSDSSEKRKQEAVKAALRNKSNDGLVKTKYKSWKHKICPSVEFK